MKSKFFAAIFAFAALVACSSNNSEEPQVGELSLSTQSLSFAADQLAAQTISVSFDGNWFIKTNNEDWLTVNRESNSSISVKVSKNTESEPRSATFSVRSVLDNGPSKEVTVTQEGFTYGEEPVLAMDPTYIVFKAKNPDPVTVHITAKGGVKWAFRISSDDALFFYYRVIDDNTVQFIPYGDSDNAMYTYEVNGTLINTNDRVFAPAVPFTLVQKRVTDK